MAMKVLEARYISGEGYRFVIHLDTTRVDANGVPDPVWVRQWTWGEAPPPGQTQAAYRQFMRDSVRELARKERRDQQAGTAMAEEGQEFS